MKVSPEILNLSPYKPGKPIAETQREYGVKKVYKLASNENPLGPSPLAVQALKTALEDLHRYPDPVGYDLVQTLQELWKIPANRLALGNGSNEIIDILIRIFCEPGDCILTTQAAFVAYEICAQAARVRTIHVPLLKDFRMDLAGLATHLKNPKVKMVFIPNPNNPTGTVVSHAEILDFMKHLEGRDDILVVFDEAYHEFVRTPLYRSALDFTLHNPQVIVMRTLSKVYGLAGLRLGVLVASPEVIDLYNRVRNPFNINSLAQLAAVAALRDTDYIQKSQKVVWQALDYFYDELKKMGLRYIESQGNFLMFDTGMATGKIYEGLLRRGVILRPLDNYGFKTQLRISAGLPEENQIAIAALKEVLQEQALTGLKRG
jgi:histidinol-phosphate aminotransferase